MTDYEVVAKKYSRVRAYPSKLTKVLNAGFKELISPRSREVVAVGFHNSELLPNTAKPLG
jgi:hypothetical protein